MVAPRSLSKGADAHSLQVVCLMQMVLLLWKTFEQNLLGPRSKPEKSEAAASKAAEELEAEKAAHCRSREEMAGMAANLKVATDRQEVLEREHRAEQEGLQKADAEAKDARSAMRAMKEELRQVRDIVAGKPFMLRRKFTDLKYAQLGRLYGAEDPYLDLAASAADAVMHFEARMVTKRKSFSGPNSIVRSTNFR